MSLKIKVTSKNWGVISHADAVLLFNGVAQQFTKHLRCEINAILFVKHDKEQRIAQVRRPSWLFSGHVVTLVSSEPFQWCFQLAHELAHVAIGYRWINGSCNHWFHEAVCDAFALFTVREFANALSQSNRVELTRFSELFLSSFNRMEACADFKLNRGETISEWLSSNEKSLRENPYQKSKNGILAFALLPILEKHSDKLAIIGLLPKTNGSFARFLERWNKKCPLEKRPLVEEMAATFFC